MLIDENYIEFSISIWRNVPVVNTKLCRFTVVVTSLHQWTDVKDEWGHKASPCCKLKCLIVNILWHCTNILFYIKILTIDWQIKGIRYTIQKTWSRYFLGGGGGVATFGGPLLSGFTSGHKKLMLFSGSRYFRGVVTIGTLRYIGMCSPIGSGDCAVLVWKRVYTLPILVWIRVWFSQVLWERMNVFIVSIPNE